ncbi:TetR/AcrR family transcriptional regulator [Pedobacter heparinus]|uniref:TetR/AcrR family transcriptional regulator n=1 Tax=Pedobacter heparinus TaxID=984 RepID=UPI0029303BA5|nr:TetR/AcrR family transcriptional regulator [Pedobacter heparinus]
MTKANRTRNFIIEKTAAIFNTKGYSATSLSDMTAATGLTKGSIYGNFANRDEVAIAAYEYNSKALSEQIDRALNAKETAKDKLMSFVAHYRTAWKDEFDRGGCPILNASVEADDNLPFLKEKVQQSISSWALKLSQVIVEGQEHGEFKKEASARDYAYVMITLIEGGIMLGKITNDEKHLFLALDRVVQLINNEIIR